MQGISQVRDEVGVFVAQVGVDPSVVDVNTRIRIAHHHLDNTLDVLLAGGCINQHVVNQVTANGTVVFPVTQSWDNNVSGGLIGLRQRARITTHSPFSIKVEALRVYFYHGILCLLRHIGRHG